MFFFAGDDTLVRPHDAQVAFRAACRKALQWFLRATRRAEYDGCAEELLTSHNVICMSRFAGWSVQVS
jgi:hypothetical protein